jgi:hypothetical protein
MHAGPDPGPGASAGGVSDAIGPARDTELAITVVEGTPDGSDASSASPLSTDKIAYSDVLGEIPLAPV